MLAETINDSVPVKQSSPRDQLNAFISSRHVSPIRHTLTIPWDIASSRTKRLHTTKAKQIIEAVCEEIAPQDHENLLNSVVTSYKSSDSSIDTVLLDALTECYNNANNWSTRRQILSIIADKVDYEQLQRWIPDITRYRYNVARYHHLLHGRGAIVPVKTSARVRVSHQQLNHFLNFITNPYIMQDMPFGERTIKLSSKIELKIPNVIRTMIPTQVIAQYESYCKESGFAPMSSSTLSRILSVCTASVQRSLQGLDYFSADGSKAFDEIHQIIERLGDEYDKGYTWAKSRNESLKNAKRYLKSDYKVTVCL